MITGIDRPTSGEVVVGGTPVHTLKEGEMAQWRGKNLGIVFQFFQLLPTLTVAENVMLPMDFCNMYPRRERLDRALHLLELVDIAEHAHKLPTAISGGQQQRAAIARALANDPPILMADEPTGNLDSRTADAVFDLFSSLVDQGKTILMVTHDEDQAKRATRTVILADGEVVNEYLARALPALPQDKLLAGTRKLQPQTYQAGTEIITKGSSPDNFYVITRGEAEVVLGNPGGYEIVVDTLGPGQFFGEMALLRGGTRTATVRAGTLNDVEVIALDQPAFLDLVDSSDRTRDVVEQIMLSRDESRTAAENGTR